MKSGFSIRPFLFLTLVIFTAGLSALSSIGLVPYYIDGTPKAENQIKLAQLPTLGEIVEAQTIAPVLPERIVIPSVGMDLPISNPNTRDISALDEALKSGPVRYVDSALLGEKGNMLIFAHSSQLPVVVNQMYRAFNKLSSVEVGDTILVSGDGKTFTYKVTVVRKTDASEEIVNLSPKSGTRITLSTCDTFGKKSSRWIVEAELVS